MMANIRSARMARAVSKYAFSAVSNRNDTGHREVTATLCDRRATDATTPARWVAALHPLVGLAGIFRGQGIGIAKAIVSLTLFHEGRIFITNQFKQHNLKKLEP